MLKSLEKSVCPNMVKILMLTIRLAGGGAERVVSELSLNLAQNMQRRIITLTNEISYPSNMPPLSMNLPSLPPLPMNLNFKKRDLIDRLPKYIYSIIVGSIKYRKLIKEYKPDVSLSFLVFANFINILSNIGNRKTKVIVSTRTPLSMKFRNSVLDRFVKFLIKILYNKADLVTTVSRGVGDELVRDFKIDPEKIRLLYNPIDIEKIQHLARTEINDEWFDNGLPILINIGRLSKEKGQWHLIRAFSKVWRIKECKLAILGNGELKPYLEKLVRDLGLTDYVNFLGWHDNPFKYISKASIFILPSLWDAMPNVLIEAMICGCPVIATDCKYGPPEILGNGKFGILIPCMDGIFYRASDPLTPEEDFLANKIVKLLEDDNLRTWYSKMGNERVKDFDKERNIREYEKVIKE